MKKKYSPGMQQFLDIKKDYQDYILFFRMGDFYEFFFEDAVIAARELEIVLTSRSGKNDEEKIPMSGIPYKAAENYIDIMVEKGYKVAICEQVEDPREAKGVVKREVVQLITPGTVMQGKTIDSKSNNFIGSVSCFKSNGIFKFGVSFSDLTTGENQITVVNNIKEVINELSNYNVKEVVLGSKFPEQYKKEIRDNLNIILSFEDDLEIPLSLENILDSIEGKNLVLSFGRLLNYLLKTQKRDLGHLQEVNYYENTQYFKMDRYSRRNLEIVETSRKQEKKGSLLWLLDETSTAMGGRRLKQWLERPLVSEYEIKKRLGMVESFIDNYYERNEVKEHLRNVYDLERLAGRVAYGNVNAKDLIQLKKSLKNLPDIINTINSISNDNLNNMVSGIDLCEDLYDLLERSVQDDPPMSVKEGNIIKDGYNETLDNYRKVLNEGKDWVSDLEDKERILTGIKNLKVNYNRAAGYYIEVTKSNIGLVPKDRYKRKQTLKNNERYITDELKEKELMILEAETNMVDLEYDLFLELRKIISGYIPKLQHLAKVISEIDVLQGFANVSDKYHYVKPIISSDNKRLKLRDCRHPVVEKILVDEPYISNDCDMDSNREVLLITGPNMSGKSTYMRQVALCSIMAQIGCYVPANYAELPIFDQLFTRIGAGDDLVSGQSTFMVEMLETQNALSSATSDSLILLDEIGRGTSTYDGIAIAQSIIEYIHNKIGAKTFFSTHYHELTDLEKSLSKLCNIRISVKEEDGNVVFLHKVENGAADKSYGIYVAELAGLPSSLIERSKEILNDLESINMKEVSKEESNGEIVGLDENKVKALDILEDVNLLEMTPMESLNILYKVKKVMEGN